MQASSTPRTSRSGPIRWDREDIKGYLSARWNAAVPEELHYDPVKNPRVRAPRCSTPHATFTAWINPPALLCGPGTTSAFNTDLKALNAGIITPAQFIDMNEKIGGIDQRRQLYPVTHRRRSRSDPRTYQSGLMLSGKGGLTNIPIFDNATSGKTAATTTAGSTGPSASVFARPTAIPTTW